MWFRFPDGTDQVSVEQQIFREEHKDEGGSYFRAPDHFAATILGLGGFSRVEQPKGAPEDLPKEDPQATRAIDELSTVNTALQQELIQLREDNKNLIVERDSLQRLVDDMQAKLDEQDAEIADLKSSDDNSSKKKK
jgi:hypothetical protein